MSALRCSSFKPRYGLSRFRNIPGARAPPSPGFAWLSSPLCGAALAASRSISSRVCGADSRVNASFEGRSPYICTRRPESSRTKRTAFARCFGSM